MQAVDIFSWLCLWLSPANTDNSRLTAYFQHADVQANAWTDLVQLASQHLVTPALYPISVNKGLLAHIPADVLDYLQTIHQLNVQRNHALLAQSLAIIDTLNAVGIEPLALKGIAGLLGNLYPDSGMRMMGDIDLLIPSDKLQSAVTALRASGYVDEQHNVLDSYEAHHHATPLIKAGQPASVELHHALMPAAARTGLLNSQRCWQHAIDLPLKNLRCYRLSPAHQLLHNFYHSQYRDRNYLYGRLSLRQGLEWLYLSKHYAGQFDFDACIQQVQQHGLLNAFVSYNLSIEHYFKRPVELPRTFGGRLQFWRVQALRRYPYLHTVNKYAALLCLAISYLTQFSEKSMQLRYPNLPLAKARRLWLGKLKHYL